MARRYEHDVGLTNGGQVPRIWSTLSGVLQGVDAFLFAEARQEKPPATPRQFYLQPARIPGRAPFH